MSVILVSVHYFHMEGPLNICNLFCPQYYLSTVRSSGVGTAETDLEAQQSRLRPEQLHC